MINFMPKYIEPASDHFQHFQVNPEAELLRQLSEENLSRLLIEHDLAAPELIYTQRLEAELQTLKNKGYCGYFLIVADYVQWAKKNGIAVGPGRGSGPCSLVGFVLGITTIDPIRYDLPFERFINPERDTLPDFDLDFCKKRRAEVTHYIQSRYGNDRVAQISSDDTRPLPSRLVICNRPLAKLVSLYANPESGFPTAKMNMSQIANAGLVRFNAIDQNALTINQFAVQQLAKAGQPVDIDNIPLDDIGTFHLLSAGEASNIAVLDDEHYRNTLITIQPERFEHLCAVIALCQPRAQNSIPLYTERKQNPGLAHCFHPALKSITAETYGLVIYQEQVIHIAHKIAGLSLAQADSFRRTLKKCDPGSKCTYKYKFIDGAMAFGLPQAEAVALFEYIAVCEQRSFNKSHAVAFAKLAYQSAWLKVASHKLLIE